MSPLVISAVAGLLLVLTGAQQSGAQSVTNRSVEAWASADEVRIIADSPAPGDVQDFLDFNCQTGRGFHIYAHYKFSNNTLERKRSSSVKFLVSILGLIEYVPSSDNEGYQPPSELNREGDEIVSAYAFDQGWSDFELTTETTSGVPVRAFTTRTSDGVFVARGKIAQAVLSDSSSKLRLSPNFIKFDFEVHNYPYRGINTSLALQSRVQSVQKIRVRPKDTDRTVAGSRPIPRSSSGSPRSIPDSVPSVGAVSAAQPSTEPSSPQSGQAGQQAGQTVQMQAALASLQSAAALNAEDYPPVHGRPSSLRGGDWGKPDDHSERDASEHDDAALSRDRRQPRDWYWRWDWDWERDRDRAWKSPEDQVEDDQVWIFSGSDGINAVSGMFSWTTNVVADGETMPISSTHRTVQKSMSQSSTEHEQDQAYNAWFSVLTRKRITHLIWDPEVGVSYHAPVMLSGLVGYGTHITTATIAGAAVCLLILRGLIALLSLGLKSARRREYVEIE